MTKTYKVAGQAAPAADTDTVLYTVPASTTFVQSTLSVCNRNIAGLIVAFNIAVVPSGETLATKHYLEYQRLIKSRDSKKLTLGLSLAAGDRVYVRASSADLSFSLFGVEIA